MCRVVLTPFPNIEDGLKWDFMGLFRNAEYGINRTEQLLASVLDRIHTGVPRWIDQVEQDLTRVLSKGQRAKRSGNDPVLMVKGSTEAAAQLSNVTRRLLRADCVFKASDEHPLFGALHSGSDYPVPLSLFYPDLLITHRDKPWNPEWFQLHPEASRVAKALLACLDMQDAAHAEMKTMGCRFVCGRCSDRKARDWSGIIGHYIQEQRRHRYKRIQPPDVSRTNRHSLTEALKEPLVQIIPTEQPGEVLDVASVVPPLKPWSSERDHRHSIEDYWEFNRDRVASG
ncbi:hypothetical protein FRC08_010844 [Ceratobasidium sp. 394]|nr:hypothetical protein FRC08_010844 [Ceratobasidium sp. 394]